MVTKNAGEVIGEALESIDGLWDELLVGDAGSTDATVEIVKEYKGRIVRQSGNNLGGRKQKLVKKAGSDWTLILDSDERVSDDLRHEIKEILAGNHRGIAGWRIPYQNYVFNRPVFYGGEKYSKVRLFKKHKGHVTAVPLHEDINMQGKLGDLKGVIYHHSYRTPFQLLSKFTRYARIAAVQKKRAGEKLTPNKLFLYGPHMFWSRFFVDKGYKDGWRGLVLAAAFAYMETLTYWLLFCSPKNLKIPRA